jgi:hypothetical protein
MTILRANTISGLGTDGPVFDGSLEFNSQNYVILPKGTTSDRVGVGSTAGALRYNTDSNKVELWDGNQWVEVQSSRPDLNGGARGVFGGGSAPGNQNVIQYITISSTGNSQDFGDLAESKSYLTSCSSSTRGLFIAGINTPVVYNTIEFITISSTGNSQDFGDVLSTGGRYGSAACSSSTRGIVAGGFILSPAVTPINNIEYVTIAATGNAVDFGDLSTIRNYMAPCSSPTRGVFAGGTPVASPYTPLTNVIEYVTISTLGNVTDFGDLTSARSGPFAGCSNATRGIFGGGYTSTPTFINTIDYITISTLGNAVKFGDMTSTKAGVSASSSSTRGVFGGGQNPTNTNVIEYVTILTQGNAIDFGDLLAATVNLSACSNGHGGL